MYIQLRELLLGITLVVAGCGEAQCNQGCFPEAAFLLERPATGDGIEVRFAPGGPHVTCTSDQGSMNCDRVLSDGVRLAWGPNAELIEAAWQGPPVGESLQVTITVDGQLYAEEQVMHDPPTEQVCGERCPRNATYELE